MLNRHVQRIKAQGVRASLLYYANTGVLEKSGLHVLNVFRHTSEMDPGATDAAFEILAAGDALTEADRRALVEYGGEALIADFKGWWAGGQRCAVARRGGELACVCWLTPETDYLPSAGAACVFVQRCFTLPAHRGLGLYPQTLRFAAAALRREQPQTPIFIESAVFNTGSIHGIEKAGFTLAGVRIRLGERDWFLPGAKGQRPWRQAVKQVMIRSMPRRLLTVSGPVRGNAVYLTFDDGPHPENTPPLLDLLREHNVPATFFVVGACAERYPSIIERMVREGHAVGHHSYHHAPPSKISAGDLMKEVEMTRRVLEPLVGKQRMFRPPNGAVTAAKLLRLWLSRHTVVLWNADPKDCDVGRDELASWFVEHALAPGDIVLLHDDQPRAMDVLPEVIASARRRGLSFRALDQDQLD